MKMEKRMEIILKTLEQMGGPIDAVNKGTDSVLNKMSIWGDKLLRRMILPAFERLGSYVGMVTDYFGKNETQVLGIATQISEMGESIFGVAEGAWNLTKSFFDVTGLSGVLEVSFSNLWKWAVGVFDALSLGGTALNTIGAYLDAINGDSNGSGMARFYALAEGLEIKFLRLNELMKSLHISSWEDNLYKDMSKDERLRKFIPADWLRRQKLQEQPEYKSYLDDREDKLFEREKALGMSHTTAGGRERARLEAGIGMGQEARDALMKSILGNKGKPILQMNVNKIEISQDFKDADPDRILVEFVRDLERLSEAAIQSTVGGGGMAYSSGSSYGG
jgi:hypothetical protein